MTFIVKTRGDTTRPIVAEYTCDACGLFDVLVDRDASGGAPDEVPCIECAAPATWTPSAVAGHVRRVEVVRGGWQKPERKTWLDTRELGEGQSLGEFREKRRAIRAEQRRREIKDLA